MPNEMAGKCGFIFDPASTIKIGIRELLNAARVINAGEGMPSGVAGTPEIDLHCP